MCIVPRKLYIPSVLRLKFIFWLQKFEYAHKHIENTI